MSRGLRWLQFGAQQRQYALGLILGGTGAGLLAQEHNRNILRADAPASENDAWRSRPVIAPHNAALGDDARTSRQQKRASAKDASAGTQHGETGAARRSQAESSTVKTPEGGVADDALTAWQVATDRIADVSTTFSGVDFAAIREKVTGFLVPGWVRILPGYLDKLRNELSMAPWSLSWEIWEEAHDPEINPEIVWDASVRISKDLCLEEHAFLRKRRAHTANALARYMNVPESEVDPEDVPIIGMIGSGGGLRALVAGASSYLSAAEDGLFDCVTYSAGVSGSCWLQTLYYSSIGKQSHARIIDHLKQRIGIHIAYPPALLSLLSQAPTNKYLLSGYVEKLKGVPDADFGLVDVYGLALAARLLVPKGELGVSDWDLKISNQRFYTDDGSHPLPLYTAVRHEIPAPLEDVAKVAQEARFSTKHYDYFQWFEWSPYEFFCDELDAGIPTWAVGRQWHAGANVWRENGLALPELRVPLMMGIWGSAFCATLSHYYKEVRPIIKASGLGSLDTMLTGKNEDLSKIHPIDPAVIPNFALGLRDKLPSSCPPSMHEETHLQLMDAGMANNLPIYPMLRPGRNVDVIIAFDASADVREDNWVKVVDGYVRQRGIKGWPMGAGWPPGTNTQDKTAEQLSNAQETTKEEVDSASPAQEYMPRDEEDLSYCNVWAGTTAQSPEYMDEPQRHRIVSDEDQAHLTSPDAGIALIYFPFLANDKVPGVDPTTSDFMSTWNFVYTPEEIEKVVSLARANYREGREQTRRVIRAVWERKRNQRLEREKAEKDMLRRLRVRNEYAHMRRNGDVGHGDHFS